MPEKQKITKPVSNDRPIVTGSNGKTRQAKHGDEGREKCAKCSTDEHPVFMAAVSSRQYFSYFRCAVCGTTAKIPHYTRLAQLQRMGPRKEFAER